jgi:shikimate dehydrogenase
MSAATPQYGVIGHPVAHSWSPFIHGLFARQAGIALEYRLFDVPPQDFRRWVLEFFAGGGRGLNVTVPHKLAAAELANELTARADRANAANTLSMPTGNHIRGDNTDGAGLARDLTQNLGIAVQGRTVLIVGAGGATRGVLAPLLGLEPRRLVIANRTAGRARDLAASFADLGTIEGCGLDELEPAPADLVINATAAGLAGDVPAVRGEVVGPDTVCYDMSYGRRETPFMRWGRLRGCARAVQGWGMLVEQAAESFEIWHGVRPDTSEVLAALAA